MTDNLDSKLDGLLTVDQVAEKVGRSPATVRRYIRDGKLPARMARNEAKKFERGWKIRYFVKPADAENLARRIEAGEFRIIKSNNPGGRPKKPDSLVQGQDYSYMYVWMSAEQQQEVCRILTVSERTKILKYFAWLKVNKPGEYKNKTNQINKEITNV